MAIHVDSETEIALWFDAMDASIVIGENHVLEPDAIIPQVVGFTHSTAPRTTGALLRERIRLEIVCRIKDIAQQFKAKIGGYFAPLLSSDFDDESMYD